MERMGETCQTCKRELTTTGKGDVEEIPHSSILSGIAGILHHGPKTKHHASTKNQPFVMVPNKKKKHGRLPPRPPKASSVHLQKDFANAAERHKAMDNSYVFLPSATSFDRSDCSNIAHPSGGFSASLNVLSKIRDLAGGQKEVEQLLCAECGRHLWKEMDEEIEETEMDINALQACIERLEKEKEDELSPEDFAAEQRKILERIKQLELEIEQVDEELKSAEENALEDCDSRLRTSDESFMHDYNDMCHKFNDLDEIEAMQVKIEVAETQLNMLRNTNALRDVFKISEEGKYGSINNFRLGFPGSEIEWDEINAAWGQACFLLYTLGQFCRLKFKYQIIPMGSHPSIADSKNTYELYGPVNAFWSTKYDKAKQYFLVCLQEFANFAAARDNANKVETIFELPFKIEDGKVGGLPIAKTFSEQENDNNARVLKYTLCNLKWALYWLAGKISSRPKSSMSIKHGGANSSSQGPQS